MLGKQISVFSWCLFFQHLMRELKAEILDQPFISERKGNDWFRRNSSWWKSVQNSPKVCKFRQWRAAYKKEAKSCTFAAPQQKKLLVLQESFFTAQIQRLSNAIWKTALWSGVMNSTRPFLPDAVSQTTNCRVRLNAGSVRISIPERAPTLLSRPHHPHRCPKWTRTSFIRVPLQLQLLQHNKWPTCTKNSKLMKSAGGGEKLGIWASMSVHLWTWASSVEFIYLFAIWSAANNLELCGNSTKRWRTLVGCISILGVLIIFCPGRRELAE